MVLSKEQFISLIENHKKRSEWLDRLMSLLNDINIYDTDALEYEMKLFDTILDISFEQWAIETINWWIYETEYGEIEDMWIEDDKNNKIYLKNADELWDYIKDAVKP